MADFGSNNALQESGHWWRADETNLLFISSAEATSAFSKMYGLFLDCCRSYRYLAAIMFGLRNWT